MEIAIQCLSRCRLVQEEGTWEKNKRGLAAQEQKHITRYHSNQGHTMKFLVVQVVVKIVS